MEEAIYEKLISHDIFQAPRRVWSAQALYYFAMGLSVVLCGRRQFMLEGHTASSGDPIVIAATADGVIVLGLQAGVTFPRLLASPITFWELTSGG